MPRLPCDLCHKIKFGPNSHVYPALLSSLGQQRAADRLCTEHTKTVLDLAERWLIAVDSEYLNDGDIYTNCMGCGRETDTRERQFFMTVYPKGERRQDYYGLLHDKCHPPEWLEALLAANPTTRV